MAGSHVSSCLTQISYLSPYFAKNGTVQSTCGTGNMRMVMMKFIKTGIGGGGGLYTLMVTGPPVY